LVKQDVFVVRQNGQEKRRKSGGTEMMPMLAAMRGPTKKTTKRGVDGKYGWQEG